MGDLDDLAGGSPVWFRALVFLAIASGAVSSGISLNTDTTDRYKGADAAADFAERDRRLDLHELRLRALEDSHSQHLQHSAQYSQIIVDLKRRFEATAHPPARVEAMLADYESRLRELERK